MVLGQTATSESEHEWAQVMLTRGKRSAAVASGNDLSQRPQCDCESGVCRPKATIFVGMIEGGRMDSRRCAHMLVCLRTSPRNSTTLLRHNCWFHMHPAA